MSLKAPVLDVGTPAVELRSLEGEVGAFPAQRPAIGTSAAIFFPVRYSASAARCSEERPAPWALMMPVLRAATMKLGDIACNV